MRLKIGDQFDNPWEYCEQDCGQFGRDLEAYLLNRSRVGLRAGVAQAFVIGLNGGYGTGKTFFLQCLRQQLAANGSGSV